MVRCEVRHTKSLRVELRGLEPWLVCLLRLGTPPYTRARMEAEKCPTSVKCRRHVYRAALHTRTYTQPTATVDDGEEYG